MLQQMKKPVAILSAFLLCLSMLTGIVLPQIAETALAVDDPYAGAHANTTEATRSADGSTVTATGGTVVPVPKEYLDMKIYEPTTAGKLFFYNPNWTSQAIADPDNDGYIVVRYGDGVKWGNGKVYLLKWGVTAFGGGTNGKTYSLDKLLQKLQAIVPTTGGDNNYYLMFLPGTYAMNTGKDVSAFNLPEGNSDPAQADLMNLHYLGPQAGRSPVTGVGNLEIANNRSVNDEREFVLSVRFDAPVNAVSYVDGIAMSNRLQLYVNNGGTGKSATYIKNVYCEVENAGANLFSVGTSSSAVNVLHFTDCYINQKVKTSEQRKDNQIWADDLLIDNVVFNNVDNQRIWVYPSTQAAANCNFLTNKGKYNATISNVTANGWNSSGFLLTYTQGHANLADWNTTDATLTITGNHFVNFGETDYNTQEYNWFYMVATNSNYKNVLNVDVSNNYIAYANNITPKAASAGSPSVLTFRLSDVSGNPISIVGNTIKIPKWFATETVIPYTDFYNVKMLTDISGNLFLYHDNTVRVPRIRLNTTSYDNTFKVVSDVYASDKMSGGLSEVFTVTGASQDLFVAGSYVQPQINYSSNYLSTYGTDVVGSVTLMPRVGTVYDVTDPEFFRYNNANVKFIGVYNDAACTKQRYTLQAGFKVCYAKAEYETELTKATIVYRLHEVANYHIVDATAANKYTLKGVGYPADNASLKTETYYTTVSAAYQAAAANAPVYSTAYAAPHDTNGPIDYVSDVVVLTAGTYTEALTIDKTVAIVGPKFGITPSNAIGGTKDVANGRSADASKEAVYNATITIRPDNNAYVALGGFATKHTTYLVKYTAADNGHNINRVGYLNLSHIYFDVTKHFFQVGTITSSTSAAAVAHYNIITTVNSCNLTTSSASDGNLLAAGTDSIAIRESTIYTPNNNSRVVFVAPLPVTYFRSRPASADFTVEGCYIRRDTYASNVTLGFSPFQLGQKDFDCVEGLAGGANFRVNNNIYYEAANNGTVLARAYAITTDTINFEMIGNRCIFGEANGSTTAAALADLHQASPINAKIENNVITNRTNPWDFKTVNTVDVNENFYGTPDSKVFKFTVEDSKGYVFDKSWWYVNEACTVKSSDIALTKGAFMDVEIVQDINNYEAKLYSHAGRNYVVADNAFTAANATVVGVYSDPAAENALSTVAFDGTDKVVYVRVVKDNYIATWKVTITKGNAWAAAGLDLAGSERYVDLTAQSQYGAREGGNAYDIVFVAPDWTKWAYKDYNGTTGELSNPKAAMAVNDIFFAKMPTSGIVYRLKYGVTAMNWANCNTANFTTIVMFPGEYATKSGYLSSGAAAANGYQATGGTGASLAVGRTDGYATVGSDFKILGPQAGMPGANPGATSGAPLRNHRAYSNCNSNNHAAEASLGGNAQIYLLGGALADGATVTIDGIAGGYYFRIGTAEGTGGHNLINTENTATINVKNCVFQSMNAETFRLYAYGHTFSTAANNAKMTLKLNIDRTYIGMQPDNNTRFIGKVYTDELHIKDSVIEYTGNEASTYNGFQIIPTKTANNTKTHALSYTCEGSYIYFPKASLFNISFDKTSNLHYEARTGLEVSFKNNILVDSSLDTTNVRKASVVCFNPGDCGNSNQRRLAEKTTINFTGNTVNNTTGAYPQYGYVIYGIIEHDAYKSINISKNTFIGYNNLYRALNPEYDYADNIYKDVNGHFISGRSHMEYAVFSDIVLSDDYTRRVSDFEVVYGLDSDGPLTWTPGAADVHGNASHAYVEGITAAELKEGIVFASKNVKVVDLRAADGVTAVGTVQPGETYRITACYIDKPETIKMVYYVKMSSAEDEIALYEGLRDYWDPDVAGMSYGTRVLRTIDGTEYQFTVGENIFATIDEIPLYDGTDANGKATQKRYVYLYAKEYTTNGEGLYIGGDENNRGIVTYFYGAKTGVSATAIDDNGNIIPNESRLDATQETVFRNMGNIQSGYQGGIIADGIMLAGNTRFSDVSGPKDGRINYFHFANISTDPADPVIATEANTRVFDMNGGGLNYLFFNNNYILTDGENIDYALAGNNAYEFEVKDNYFDNLNAANDAIRFAVVTEDGTRDSTDLNRKFAVHDNYLAGAVDIADLRSIGYVNTNVNIYNNVFEPNTVNAIRIGDYTTDGKKVAALANASINIHDNKFYGNEKRVAEDAIQSYIKINGKLADGQVGFANFAIVNNTFYNSERVYVDYAIENLSDTIVYAAPNTFDGFNYNYGDHQYMTGSAAVDGYVIKNVYGLNLGLTDIHSYGMLNPANVYFHSKDLSVYSTFVIDGTSYDAYGDNTSGGATVADAAASGSKVGWNGPNAAGNAVDQITDVATAGKNANGYVFLPAKGRNVAIEKSKGKVIRYNVIEVDMSDKAKAVVEEQRTRISTLAGEPVGGTYFSTVYAEPIDVLFDERDCKVINSNGVATLYWEARFKGKHSTYIIDLMNHSGFDIVEYGMYYAKDEAALSDVAIKLDYNTDGQYLNATGDVVGQKVYYNKSAAGIKNVKLDYKHKFTTTLPEKMETRYGRMYMTYKVGNREYTVLSDIASLNIYVNEGERPAA